MLLPVRHHPLVGTAAGGAGAVLVRLLCLCLCLCLPAGAEGGWRGDWRCTPKQCRREQGRGRSGQWLLLLVVVLRWLLCMPSAVGEG